LIPLCAGNGIQLEIEIHKDINPHFSFDEKDKRKFVKKVKKKISSKQKTTYLLKINLSLSFFD
jgi:hypothetical protein